MRARSRRLAGRAARSMFSGTNCAPVMCPSSGVISYPVAALFPERTPLLLTCSQSGDQSPGMARSSTIARLDAPLWSGAERPQKKRASRYLTDSKIRLADPFDSRSVSVRLECYRASCPLERFFKALASLLSHCSVFRDRGPGTAFVSADQQEHR